MLATSDLTFDIETTSDFGRGNLALADRPQKRCRTPKRAPAAGSVCLVVSPDPLRQMMFGQAAQRCGWKQAVCVSQAEALMKLASGVVGLVLVDTATPGESSVAERRALVEQLAGQKDLLTVVCGRTSDSQEEIWARQNAAWMYLPGVAPESDLEPVLTGAKEIVERQQRRSTFAQANCLGTGF